MMEESTYLRPMAVQSGGSSSAYASLPLKWAKGAVMYSCIKEVPVLFFELFHHLVGLVLGEMTSLLVRPEFGS